MNMTKNGAPPVLTDPDQRDLDRRGVPAENPRLGELGHCRRRSGTEARLGEQPGY